MNAENIHGLAPNRQFSLMPYSISELRGVSQRLNDGDKSGLRAMSLRRGTGDSIKLSKTTLDHSEKSFWSREGQLSWGQERSQQSEEPLHSCYTAAKFVGRVDGKICLLRGVLVNLLKLDHSVAVETNGVAERNKVGAYCQLIAHCHCKENWIKRGNV